MPDAREDAYRSAGRAVGVSGPPAVASPAPADLLRARLEQRTPVILAGPPGTGKTRLVNQMVSELGGKGQLGCVEVIQFHSDYSYQQFIYGFQPAEAGGFTEKLGILPRLLHAIEARRRDDPDDVMVDVLVIDEINRADVGSVFGEVMTLLDDRSSKTVRLANGKELALPESLWIIGTMNTADRNIALMDFALRRRFAFVFLQPDYPGMVEWITARGLGFDDFDVDTYAAAVRVLNSRILHHPLLGKGMVLGQSFFVPASNSERPIATDEVLNLFNGQVFPQIEAYFGSGSWGQVEAMLGSPVARALRVGETVDWSSLVGLLFTLAASSET